MSQTLFPGAETQCHGTNHRTHPKLARAERVNVRAPAGRLLGCRLEEPVRVIGQESVAAWSSARMLGMQRQGQGPFKSEAKPAQILVNT